MTKEQYIRDLEEARDDFQRALADAERELRGLHATNKALEDDLADTARDLQRAEDEHQQMAAAVEAHRLKLRQYLRGTCPLAQREELWEELLVWADA